MKWTIHKRIANETGASLNNKWQNYTVTMRTRKYHLAYNFAERRFAQSQERSSFEALNVSDEIDAAIIANASMQTFTPGKF